MLKIKNRLKEKILVTTFSFWISKYIFPLKNNSHPIIIQVKNGIINNNIIPIIIINVKIVLQRIFISSEKFLYPKEQQAKKINAQKIKKPIKQEYL